MIGRLALRSLTAHPIRSGVLAAGFGLGVAVMAILLGVAEIVLDQATSPALVGGGDVVIRLAPQVPAQMVLSGTLRSSGIRDRVRVAAPWDSTSVYLVGEKGKTVLVEARGGIPSLERTLSDRETDAMPGWRDSPGDVAWTESTPESALRRIDRFHPIPDAPAWASSWAEWLYFNGRANGARFYLTFLVGPALPDGRRSAGVRLQLDRGGTVESFSTSTTVTNEEALRAPDLTIGANRVRVDGMRYLIDLDLAAGDGRRVRGHLIIEGAPGRLVPPIEIAGTKGWRTGYVVPVMSGTLGGALDVDGQPVSLDGGSGYHDHNWGFWEGVSWQWGQVQQGELSILYGRVFPPRDAADPEHIPGFIGVLGPDGPLGYASAVTISEQDEGGQPRTIRVRSHSSTIDIDLRFDVTSVVTTRMTQGPLANGVNFLQLRGDYSVTGRAGERSFTLSAPGSAETFRGEGKTQ